MINKIHIYEIEVGKEYNFRVFNEKVKVISVNDDDTITIETSYGTIHTYPGDLEELKK